MKNKRATRPTLARIEPNETALIWNPDYGFRQAVPRRTNGALSVEELFISVMMNKAADEDFIQQVVANFFGQFTKH